MAEERLYLFGPKNEKDLKRQYPELGRDKVFTDLTVQQLLFTWWYSNPTSPLVVNENLNEKERIMFAYNEAFSKTKKDDDRSRDYMSGNFPPTVRMAIDRMSKFNPTVRQRAKAMLEKIISNYEELIDVDVDDFQEPVLDEDGKEVGKKINWTGRNSYVTSAKNIAEALPDLIKQVEEGFGVIETREGESGIKAISRFHATQEEK